MAFGTRELAILTLALAVTAASAGPDETYGLIAKCTESYHADDDPPALSCPGVQAGAQMLIPRSWVFEANGSISETWLTDRFGLRDRVSIYFDLWWKGCNPADGHWDMNCIGADIVAIARAGYKVAIGPGMQKAPDYLFTKFDAYWRNADGRTLQNGDFDMGCNLVFYPEARAVAREYFSRIRDRLREVNATLSLLRIGFAQTGEFNFPISNVGNDYWAFGPNGSALPGYPLGDYRPGNVTDEDTGKAFMAWYLESLATTQNELVTYVLDLFPDATAAMLYPNRETLYPALQDDTSKLASGYASGSGAAYGWVRSLLVPRLTAVKIPGKILAWSTSGLGGEERWHTLDQIESFTVFSSRQITTKGLGIGLAAENEGGQIQNFDRLRDYLGHARANTPQLVFFCCMTLPNTAHLDGLYSLVTAAADAFRQRSALCYPAVMRGVDDRIYSADMAKVLRLQGDGNLVVYSVDLSQLGAERAEWWCGSVVWSSQTAGAEGVHLAIQTDGGAHVVLYDGVGAVLAHSGYVKCSMSGNSCTTGVIPRLSLDTDGTLKLNTDIRAERITLQKADAVSIV